VSQDLSTVIPTEVEEPLIFRCLAAVPRIQRCLDFARHDSYESKVKKLARSSRKQLRFLFGGKVHRFDEFSCFCFT
jgi:hypothetical protein